MFRGIPYAAPPIGALRFRPPAPPANWPGTRDATRFGFASCQDEGLLHDVGEASEDCLSLNVWTPACDARRRPVMLFIHGGSFTVGSSAQQVHDGSALASLGDVVVVTINYRLGILGFGFFGDLLGDADFTANNGLRDQLAALRWVRDNIESFGGDPSSITVFGESAGGMSVGALLSAAAARGLVRRAIAQSGAAHHVTTRAEASRMAELFLRTLGVTGGAARDAIRSASPEAIVVAQRPCLQQSVERGPAGKRLPQGAMTLLPVADGDVLPDDPFGEIAAGCARDIDVMAGSTADEWNYFLYLVEPSKRGIDEAVLAKIFDRRLRGRGAEAIALYRGVLGADLRPTDLYCAIESDRMFRIPAVRLAEACSAHNPRTFMYLFDWKSPLLSGALGACHAIDLPFVFGTVEGDFGRAFTGGGDHAQRLSRATIAAWSSFARSGDPSHELLGDWPAYEPGRRATQVLSAAPHVIDSPLDAVRTFWDALQ